MRQKMWWLVVICVIYFSALAYSISADCASDQTIPLIYPNELFVLSKDQFLQRHPGGDYSVSSQYNNFKDTEYPTTPQGAPQNAGKIWIPKQACGKPVDVLVALHGWRSLKSPGENIYIGPEQKEFDGLVSSHLQNGGYPLIIAAPMDDRGPDETVFNNNNFDINTYLSEVQTQLALSGQGATIRSVSIMGHSNANCGGGLLKAVKDLNNNYFLQLVGSVDGTCEGGEYVSGLIDAVKARRVAQSSQGAYLFHMYADRAQSPSDRDSSQTIKNAAKGRKDKSAAFPAKYASTWASSDPQFYTYDYIPITDPTNKKDKYSYSHEVIPRAWLFEVLPRFFVEGKSDLKQSVINDVDYCNGKKIAIMGASNDVEPSYVTYLKGTCPSSEIKVFAEGSLTIQQQKKKYVDSNAISNFDPEVLIINPSGNTCAGASGKEKEKQDEVATGGFNTVLDIIGEFQTKNIQMAVLPISPRHQIDSGVTKPISYQQCIDTFNQKLSGLNTEHVNMVDIRDSLKGEPDYSCKYCRKEPDNDQYYHWTDEGDKLVAQKIITDLFGKIDLVDIVQRVKIKAGSGGTAVVAPQPGQQTAATVQIEQGCAINQRCKDIDTAWNIFGGVLGLHSGQVWVPLKNTWMTFNDAYSLAAKPQPSTQPTSSGSTGAGTGLKVVQCATAKEDLKQEEKAFLDTIAYAEGTTSVALKKTASSYGVMVGGGIFTDYAQHPYKTSAMPDVICVRRDAGGKCTLASSAAGRYGFMPKTYKGLKDAGFFQEGFQPFEQDKGALKLAEDAGVNLQTLKEATSDVMWDSIWNKVAPIWASIINSNTGKGVYEGQGYATHNLLNKAYNLCLNYYAGGGTEEKRFEVNSGKEDTNVALDKKSEDTPVPDDNNLGGLKKIVFTSTMGNNGRAVALILKENPNPSDYVNVIIYFGGDDSTIESIVKQLNNNFFSIVTSKPNTIIVIPQIDTNEQRNSWMDGGNGDYFSLLDDLSKQLGDGSVNDMKGYLVGYSHGGAALKNIMYSSSVEKFFGVLPVKQVFLDACFENWCSDTAKKEMELNKLAFNKKSHGTTFVAYQLSGNTQPTITHQDVSALKEEIGKIIENPKIYEAQGSHSSIPRDYFTKENLFDD